MSIDGYTYSPRGDNGSLLSEFNKMRIMTGYTKQEILPNGITGWISNLTSDIDGDGCRDIDEDQDDDGDGVQDTNDGCPLVLGTHPLIERVYRFRRRWVVRPDSGWDSDDGADAFPNIDPMERF